MNAGYLKPFAAAWRARAYFLAAIIFWIIYNTIPVPFPGDTVSWWMTLINKAVSGSDKISYLCLVAGFVYALLSDVLDYVWATNLQQEIRAGFAGTSAVLKNSLTDFKSGLVGMTFESVKVWVEGGRGDEQQTKVIARSALVGVYGPHNDIEGSLVDFSLRGLLDNWACLTAQTWQSFNSNVTIRSSPIRGHFEWEENRSYTMFCKAGSGTVPLKLEGSCRVQPDQVLHVLNHMEFRVRCGSQTVIDFKSWWAKKSVVPAELIFKMADGGHSIEYDGTWLAYSFEATYSISDEKTYVTIYEKSLLSEEDRCYALLVRHPTNGLSVTLALEGLPGWTVQSPLASAVLYNVGAKVVQLEAQHQHRSSVAISGWTLPGVAVVIEWTPPNLK